MANWNSGPDELHPADSYTTTRLDGAVRLRYDYNGEPLYNIKPESLYTVFKNTVKRVPDKIALIDSVENQKRTFTFTQYFDECIKAAKSFIHLGLGPAKSVAIIGFNAPEWTISLYGAMFAAGVGCGLYATNTPDACQFCINDSSSEIIVVEDEMHLAKILKIKDNCQIKSIIQYKGTVTNSHNGLVISWDDFMKLADGVSEEQLNARIRQLAPNKCATLIYTSGTTGTSKAAMISHDNINYTANYIGMTTSLRMDEERLVSYLPLSHIAAQILDAHFTIAYGATVYFAPSDAIRKGTLGKTLQEVKPTVFVGVPRVWEKMHEKIEAYIKSTKTTVTTETVLNLLGLQECKAKKCSAAPLGSKTLEFFQKFDIVISEIYGMSESTGPHVSALAYHNKVGSVGDCSSQFNRTKIVEPDAEGNGELCMYGRHVMMGYLNTEAKTRETIDAEGWLHSGDLARIDEHKFVYITGRIKEILITAGGENVYPVPIEETIVAQLPQVISNVMTICDHRNYLTALVTLRANINPDTTASLDELSDECKNWLQQHGSSSTKVSEVLSQKDKVVYEGIYEAIQKANEKAISNVGMVKKFTILPRDFSVATGELGPTLKLRRPIVAKIYGNEIERMYTSDGNYF